MLLHPAHARLQGEADMAPSPITPNYKFGHDDHYEHAHAHGSGHAPNLHDHSHAHGHAHEGHSDNMRGVFLHVMAVRPLRLLFSLDMLHEPAL